MFSNILQTCSTQLVAEIKDAQQDSVKPRDSHWTSFSGVQEYIQRDANYFCPLNLHVNVWGERDVQWCLGGGTVNYFAPLNLM